LLVLFKVNAFPFKKKAIFSTRRQLLLYLARRHVCFVLMQSVHDCYFFKLNCFKLIGWFNHHNVFPPIRSICYRFLHCDYRKLHCDYKKLHCDYRKLHCCWGLTALKSTNHIRVISLCIFKNISISAIELLAILKMTYSEKCPAWGWKTLR
jgi:hypothetical protein